MDTTALLFGFKEHLQVLNRSPATIRTYCHHVRLFLQMLEVEDIRAVTRQMIEDYIASLYDHRDADNQPYKIGTICLKVRSLKRFFEYLETANRIFINPAENIREPQKQRHLLRNVLTRKQMNNILDQPNLALMTGIRDRAVLELFYSTGIRRGELCRLSVFDADLQGGMLRVNSGKGQKDRVVPMGRHAVRCLREYITKARPRLTKNDRKIRRLFVNRYGGPVSGQVVALMIRTCARQANIGKPVTAHTFRHSFATALVKNGADILAVQKMLGHADLSTTQVYIRSLGLDIKAVHRKTHPREKDKPSREVIRPRLERVRHASE